MALYCTVPPLVEPVDITELKAMLRINAGDTSQDDVLLSLEMAARSWCEALTNKKFVQQTWTLATDFFPGYIDMKVAGQKVSSPFVSGANAILVGIRYAFQLPFPPVQSLNSFIYQNANGQITSMIVGPESIASVSNVLGNPVLAVTSTAHNLMSGSTALVGGNAPLIAVLGGQSSQVVTVIDQYTLQFNGSLGNGVPIAGGGTITGFNFVQDLVSNPARLTPIFGQMWPVARVTVNAVQINYTVGYATPISVTTQSETNQSQIDSPYPFTSANIGQPISIPGASSNGGCLNTIIQSISSGSAVLRDQPMQKVDSTAALLVTNGQPSDWESVKLGIKFLVNAWFVNRVPAETKELKNTLIGIVGHARDMRI